MNKKQNIYYGSDLDCLDDRPAIKDVIFNPPATIILWDDGSKTVVKTCKDDIYSPEVGLAMAISKKFLGDKFHYTFRKYVKNDKKQPTPNILNWLRDCFTMYYEPMGGGATVLSNEIVEEDDKND